MVVSIGAVAAPAQGASYYERDGYYGRDDPEHRASSAWAGRGAEDLGLAGPVDPGVFRRVLEGRVPGGRLLGRPGKDGTIDHRPGRDVTFSAPKSVSIAALVGGDGRIAGAHERAVRRALAWIEENVVETRLRDPATGRMVRAGGQKMVAATFRHDTSRNLDPQLHTHAVIANMIRGGDGKWRTMANERLYASSMLIGALYRNELARELSKLGYRIEKTHADGRFEIAGVPGEVIGAFSTRRAEIVGTMETHGLGTTRDNPRLAQKAALMTRAAKRDIDRAALGAHWRGQARDLGFDAEGLAAEAIERSGVAREAAGAAAGQIPVLEPAITEAEPAAASEAVAWAVAHLSEREAVFPRNALYAAALSRSPGAAGMEKIVDEVSRLEAAGALHAADPGIAPDSLTTDRAVAEETETLALMRAGQGRAGAALRARSADKALRGGPLTGGQKSAVKLILSSKDRVVGVQGYAGTGKTAMLDRARALLVKRGYAVMGLAPSATAARNLEAEAGIASETLQRFLARNAGIAEGRLSARAGKRMRVQYAKTVLVVDESSFASTLQARNLLRIANALRVARVVVVGDAQQLGAVDAGKPFSQLQKAGMVTAVMGEIRRQRDPDLKAAVEASVAGDIARAFDRLGENIAEVKPDNLAGAAAARWLALDPEAREQAGLIAPSHDLRRKINAIVRERLVRDGTVHGPAMTGERLVSKGYTNAEKSLAGNYAPGDVVAFHRSYKRLGVEKGDEMRVVSVDQEGGIVHLEGKEGAKAAWEPARLAARSGGIEALAVEAIELSAGDRIRWTRNDARHGLVNSQTAEVVEVKPDGISFRLEDGRTLHMERGDPQLRHVDRAWASTVHAFQGRTVDTVIAAMESRHPHLTNQRMLYVEISRARHRAELVTDDRAALAERLKGATGERIAALEAVGKDGAPPRGREREFDL